MKIKIETIPEGSEPEIIIRSNEPEEAVQKLLNFFRTSTKKVIGFCDTRMVLIDPQEVYYFETVDNRVFIYCKDQVYEAKLKLYQLEEEYENSDFFRASKSVILNLGKIETLSPAFSGRFEALLRNGEKVIISRQYVPVPQKKVRPVRRLLNENH